ncbi:hypothetical protein [Dactylosporangium sp. NPDC050588]|uniref:hypothetical protein n=1 Tax=Dactylosporangium sp. NPDC050588 TaxID=3157211 RepID=UPI003407F13B
MLFVAGLLAVCAAAQVAVILAPTAGTIATVGAGTTLLALATNVRLFRRFAAGTGRARVAWGFAGLASSGWTLACLLYVLDVVAGRDGPPPRAGDWASLLAVGLAPAVLLSAPAAPQSLEQRVRLALDGVMVAAALFVLAWPLLLRDTMHAIGSLGGVVATGVPSVHIVARVASSGCPVRVGASAGVVVRTPGLDGETMFRLADAALYRSKAAGKGRVELHVAA